MKEAEREDGTEEAREAEPEADGAAEELQRKRKGKAKRERRKRSRSGTIIEIQFPVIKARGIHLFPYRTQKLSLSALMVLGWKRPGRVGRRRIPIKGNEESHKILRIVIPQ